MARQTHVIRSGSSGMEKDRPDAVMVRLGLLPKRAAEPVKYRGAIGLTLPPTI